jgi:rhomboid protease GluP
MSEFSKQTLLYWRLLYDLIVEKGFEVIKMDQGQQVLLKSPKYKGPFIRIVRHDVDWANWLRSDIHSFSNSTDPQVVRLVREKVPIYNIYVTTYPPVDDWDPSRLNVPKHMKTSLIHIENRFVQLEKLYKEVMVENRQFRDWINGNEESITAMENAVKQHVKSKKKKEQALFQYGNPILTYFLIGINISMYFLLEQFGGSKNIGTLIEFGAKYNPLIIEGEWWRFITPIFLHIGFFHLFMNTLALYYLGTAVERIYGTVRYFVIYFVSGIGGVLASFAFHEEISAGASGAIFGCFGALLYFGTIHRSLFFRTMGANLLIVLTINISIGFLVPMVDNSAHIGGLIGGYLAAALMQLPQQRLHVRQVLSFAALILLSGGLFIYGNEGANKGTNDTAVVQLASYYIENDQLDKAQETLDHAVKNSAPDEITADVYFMLSYVKIKQNKFDEAASDLYAVIEKDEHFHEAYYNLALIYIEKSNVAKARSLVEKALEIDPENKDYRKLYRQLHTD